MFTGPAAGILPLGWILPAATVPKEVTQQVPWAGPGVVSANQQSADDPETSRPAGVFTLRAIWRGHAEYRV